MLDFSSFTTSDAPVGLALLLVVAYFVLVSLILRIPGRQRVSVPRYEPPQGASPAVAAWLCEHGSMPRAMAAALINMAAKGYLKLEQTGDLVSITQVASETPAPLEPEEDVVARLLLREYDCFDFVQATPQLAKTVKEFRWALLNRGYFSPHTGLFIPAWIVSGLATLFVFF